MMNRTLLKFVNIILTVIICAFSLVVILICVRVFMFDTFRIPSNSMEPTIINGDKVLANKLIFGARIYKNLDFIDGGELETWRVRGLRPIKHNDMVVFNYPYETRTVTFDISVVHLKRCVGIPGDTLSIRDGFIRASSFSGTPGYYESQLELSLADSTRIDPEVFGALKRRTDNYWTIRNLGPVYVPRRGGSVGIDSSNYGLYAAVIEYETGKKLRFRDGVLKLGDEEISRYTFLQNYYFMVGDNAMNSRDSRYWGFVPEEYIVGVVTRVLYSKDPNTGKFRRDRWFKKLE